MGIVVAGGRVIRRCPHEVSLFLWRCVFSPPSATLFQPLPGSVLNIRNRGGGASAGTWSAGASFVGVPGAPIDEVSPSAFGTVSLYRSLAALTQPSLGSVFQHQERLRNERGSSQWGGTW